METIDSIPISKIRRASKLVGTGAKVGVNYLKYYGSKLVKTEEDAREQLNKDNAEDIYNSLKQLKGSALKVAQMLSMEKSIMPAAYVEKFSLSQFSVPPLSPPLVIKTFKKYFGKTPNEVFDEFNSESTNAASIGQVHKAKKDGQELAVKIQYPGVSQSISSDLKLVKPVALRILNISAKDSTKYFQEVEDKLMEETNYLLELESSKEISEACKNIPNLLFPKYYSEFSSEMIITMDWMTGKHLSEYTTTPESGKKIGQALWDFYMYQMHVLKRVHADPHPGNFLVDDSGALVAIDFGCIKDVPEDFYVPYFELATSEAMQDRSFFIDKITTLEILRPDDSEEDSAYITDLFHELLGVLTFPFHNDTFDFSDELFWAKVAHMSERLSQDDKLEKLNGNRGSKHFLYINRTFFGLYNLLHDLKADIVVNNYKKFI